MRYTRQARQDTLDIWVQIGASRPASADRILDVIEDRCGQLSQFPKLGPSRPDIFIDARVLVIDRWLAIYALDAAGPQIVRIVDASRDLTKLTFLREE